MLCNAPPNPSILLSSFDLTGSGGHCTSFKTKLGNIVCLEDPPHLQQKDGLGLD